MRSFGLVVEDGRGAIELAAAKGGMLPKGRYLLSLSIRPQKEGHMSRCGIDLGVARRTLPLTLEFSGRHASVPIVLTQDLPYLTVTAVIGKEVLSDAEWRLQPMAYIPFYSVLSFRAGWRLLRRKENKSLFIEAISRNGVSGFAAAVRGDWEAALTLPHSGFTGRVLRYIDATKLPTRAVTRIPGLEVIGDFSASSDVPCLDDTLLRGANLAGLTALCLPCKGKGGELSFPSAVLRFLDNPGLHFPFFFCFADARVKSVDQNQEYALAEAIAPWFDDPCYFCVDGKPVVAVPSHADLPSMRTRVEAWRAAWWARGKSALIIEATSHNGSLSKVTGCDGVGISVSNNSRCDDETQEKKSSGISIPDTPPVRFGRSVHAALVHKPFAASGTSFVFVDFGALDGVRPSLTEDERYGYAWIESLRVAQARRAAEMNSSCLPLRAAVVVHAFYPELLSEMLEKLRLDSTQKLFVTTVEERRDEIERVLREADVSHVLHVFENRGRDVLPFMKIFDEIVAEGFDIVVKIHTKKSGHRRDGDAWRRNLVDPILDDPGFNQILAAFEKDRSLGMVGSKAHLTSLDDNIVVNEARVFDLARRLGLVGRDVKKGRFFAGSMFVARTSALAPLMSLAIQDEDFEPEAQQLDGTMAHVVERGFALSVISCGMRLAGLEEAIRKRRTIWSTLSRVQ